MKVTRSVGINDILSFANVVVFSLICYVLFFEPSIEENPYLDSLSLILGLMLCVQTQIFLYIEKRNTDPFVLVMAYVTTLFYSLRIFTLTLYPYSTVFDRVGEYSPADSNFSLLIIIIANTCLATGFFSHKLRSKVAINVTNYRPIQPKIGTFAICLIIILSSLNILNLAENVTPLVNLVLLFFSPPIVSIVLATYIFTFRLHIKLFYKLTLIAIALFLLVLQTLNGSRSGILTYIQYAFFLTIVLVPFFRIRLSAAIYTVVLAPTVLLLLGYIFVLATMSQGELYASGAKLSIAQTIDIISEVAGSNQVSVNLEPMTGLIVARAGFFDFTSEIIAHRKIYSELFTPSSYLKSIIDNVLTPGFDIFDYPRIGNGLSQVYRGASSLSKRAVIDAYQSDQISLIAESFSIFGYFSFFILFLLGRFFKVIYSKSVNVSPFNLALKRVFLVIIFHAALLSFGLDWMLLDMILMVFTVMLIKPLFRVEPTNAEHLSIA